MSDRVISGDSPEILQGTSAVAGGRARPPDLVSSAEATTSGSPALGGGSSVEMFLFYRDGTGRQQVVGLGAVARLTLGRSAHNDVRLEWDGKVSRLHAVFERIGGDWILVDGGLSRNGTFVNGERLAGRCRLADGDVILVGSTSLTYHDYGCGLASRRSVAETTQAADDVVTVRSLSATQLQVLEALCRPYRDRPQYATPATNRQIADELFFSVEAVKTHLRVLFRKFGVEELPQNQKRAKLVELALQAGLVSDGR